MTEAKTGIYKALADAMGEVKRISKDNRNAEQKYDFASVDDFMAMVGPICAKHGIITVIDEEPPVFVEKQGKFAPTQWAQIGYTLTTFHTSGEALPPVRRHVEVIRSGPQAYGSAQSYIIKQYYRGLLNIPTGDKDDPDFGAVEDQRDQMQRDERPAPPSKDALDAAVASIHAATTGKALLAAIPGPLAGHPQVLEAVTDTLRTIVHGAPTTAALDAMAKAFAPVWPSVADDAKARAAELANEAPF